VNLAVAKIHQIWLDSTEQKGAQLVFCDLSTPQTGGHGFSVYHDVRDKLVARGVASAEIAFIQDFDEDAAKSSLFKSVREGKVRILLGSTPKMACYIRASRTTASTSTPRVGGSGRKSTGASTTSPSSSLPTRSCEW
jgi:hypothetical protein